jgi:DNA-binding NtrC family response regulator
MAKELVQALTGERQELRLEAGMRLEPALQALKNGFSLIDIIQHVLEHLERYLITQILVCTKGNKAEAARILKIDYKTLYRKMYKYFGTFSDFVPAAEADIDGCSPAVAPPLGSHDD